MKLEYDNSHKVIKISNSDHVYIKNIDSDSHEILTYMGYAGDYFFSKVKMKKSDLNKIYDPIENLPFLDKNEKTSKIYRFYNHYKSKKLDYIIKISNCDINNKHINVYKLYYKYSDVDGIEEEFNKCVFAPKKSSGKISVVLQTKQGIVFKQHTINPLPINKKTMYNDDFLDISNHIENKLITGKKGVVLLHGAAGTGKSNYIKHLTTVVEDKNFVFIPIGVIPSLTDPSFLSELIDNKGSVLVLEDCENFIKDRNKEGNNGVVSTILNLSDGILSDVLEIQIICTFNTNLSNIDSALLRKGRLISEYKFDKLSKEKVKNLCKELKYKEVIDEELTLSEVFNLYDNSTRVENKQGKIGFR